MISLYDILEAADGQLFGEAHSQLFADFCVDARQARPDQVYVAIKTARGDGHQYMEQAVAGGVTGIICTHPPMFDTEGLTVVVTRSVEDALLRWASIVLRKYGTTVIGVTGSTGKSITRAAIAHVLSRRFNVYQNTTTTGGRLGLPLALGQLTKEHQIAVLEYGVQQPGEMEIMIGLSTPIVGVVTTINRAHLDQLGTLENSAREYRALVKALPPEGLAVLNFNDPLVRAMAAETQGRVMTVGLDPAFGADLLAYNILLDRDKTGFDLRTTHSRHPGRWIPWLGAHQLYAALMALAVGQSYGIGLEDGLHTLTDLPPQPGRMRPFDGLGGSLLIDDAASAGPDDTLAALDWLAAVRTPETRTTLILGDLDNSNSTGASLPHIEIGQRVMGVVDRLITRGEFAAEAARTALDLGMERGQVRITFSVDDAATAASDGLGPQDVVLIKGGRNAGMERITRWLLASSGDTGELARPAVTTAPLTVRQPDAPSWLTVDLNAVGYNTRRIKEIIGDEVALLAVVKADAYGHGAVPVSVTALNNGASYLGVGSLREAIALREAGIDAPILIMGFTPPTAAREIIRHSLTITLYDTEIARAFQRAAQDHDGQVRAHVKIDTGLGRLGLLPDEVTRFFRSARTFDRLQIEGIFTTLAAADQDDEMTARQIAVFEQVIQPLVAAGFRFKYVHAANTAAAIHRPETRFSMVRCGIGLYGVHPSLSAPLPMDLRPALSWTTSIVQVKQLPAGATVGFGQLYRAPATVRIAIIPVGYADGLRRSPRGWRKVLVRGQEVRIIGRISMDMAALDVTALEDVQIGEEVVLIGQQGGRQITLDDVAEALDTSSYEIATTLLARVPRTM